MSSYKNKLCIKSEPKKIDRVLYVKHHTDGCVDSENRFSISTTVYYTLFKLILFRWKRERERRKKCMMRWWKKTPFFLLECLYKNYHVNDGKVCCVYVNQQTRGLRPSIKCPKIHWKIFLDVRHCLPYCDEIRFP